MEQWLEVEPCDRSKYFSGLFLIEREREREIDKE